MAAIKEIQDSLQNKDLEQLTERLPQISSLSTYTEYEVTQGGPLFAFTLYHHPDIAIVRAFAGAGTTIEVHTHVEQEFYILYEGEMLMRYEKGDEQKLISPQQHYVPSGIPHGFCCPVNTWMVVITIPAAPDALIGIGKKLEDEEKI